MSSAPPSTPPPTNSSAASSDSSTARAGRGGLAVAGAKLYFILVGFVQQIAFGRILGLEGYGALSTALSASSIAYNPITQASIQGVSREVAGAPLAEQPRVFRRALVLHGGLAVVSSVLFFVLATPVAEFLGAPHVASALRVLSLVLFLYGLYTPLVGALNGLRRFGSQALLDVIAATLRTVGLLVGAAVGVRVGASANVDGVRGAAIGFVLGAVVILGVAAFVAGTGQSGGSTPEPRRYLGMLGVLLVGQALLNLLFQADALLLRRLAADAALRAGEGLETADRLVGAYRGAQLFGFLPYQLLMSVTFVLFPLLARSRSEGDPAAVRTLVREGVRIAVLLAGLMTSVLVAVPDGVIGLVFGPEAAALGGTALRLLALGLGAFAVFGVMTSAQNSLGGERGSLVVTALAVAFVLGFGFFLARDVAPGAELLTRVALATSLGLWLATGLAALRLRALAGGVVGPSAVARALTALVVAGSSGAFVTRPGFLGRGPIGTVAGALLAAFVYVAVLLVTRELTAHDRARVLAIVRRRPRPE